MEQISKKNFHAGQMDNPQLAINNIPEEHGMRDIVIQAIQKKISSRFGNVLKIFDVQLTKFSPRGYMKYPARHIITRPLAAFFESYPIYITNKYGEDHKLMFEIIDGKAYISSEVNNPKWIAMERLSAEELWEQINNIVLYNRQLDGLPIFKDRLTMPQRDTLAILSSQESTCNNNNASNNDKTINCFSPTPEIKALTSSAVKRESNNSSTYFRPMT